MPQNFSFIYDQEQPSKVAERFRAHAELLRKMAGRAWDEDVVSKLERLAQECLRAARYAEGKPARH